MKAFESFWILENILDLLFSIWGTPTPGSMQGAMGVNKISLIDYEIMIWGYTN
jgi:hypothetical protein